MSPHIPRQRVNPSPRAVVVRENSVRRSRARAHWMRELRIGTNLLLQSRIGLKGSQWLQVNAPAYGTVPDLGKISVLQSALATIMQPTGNRDAISSTQERPRTCPSMASAQITPDQVTPDQDPECLSILDAPGRGYTSR